MTDAGDQGRTPNRLIHETSPYLLQHAYNPVDWYPWGEEALRRAKEENKPILLSIGYSACHWCHVMERESFEDPQIAALMNESFVCVKVDREERPDLDEIYMQATLALNQGQGGWPMTVFLTPDQRPIYAGTYFPPTDRWGRPGFATLLTTIAEFWRKDEGALRQQAEQLTETLKKESQVIDHLAMGEHEIEAVVAQLGEDFDERHGGFGHAPKFPPTTALTLLLRWSLRTGEARSLAMVRKTLDAMAAGGLYDQIGGGFARYSTDERWLVPHFEKMLYDNALLARCYVEAWQATGEPAYRRIATETLDYILREMTAPDGGFYSATDADSEGVEGKFFVWTPEEIARILPDERDARLFCAYYDITPGGNWERRSIPNRLRPAEEVARDLGMSVEEVEAAVARLRPRVYEARATRVPPALDDKILTAWNGMMLSAMAEAARLLGEPRYLAAAEKTADFLLTTHSRPDGGLYRTSRLGRAHLPAYLEDYAWLAEGLIDLYEAGAEERYLREALRLAERILADFADREHGGFFTTAEQHETLIVRVREGADGATPSGNAVAAEALARLAFHFDRPDLREQAALAVRAYGRMIARHPRAFAKGLLVADLLLHGPVELAFVGTPGEPGYEALLAEVRRHPLPRRIIAHHDPSRGSSAHPLLKGKGLVGGRAALYVCRNFACGAPVTEPGRVAAALAGGGSSQAGGGALRGARLAGRATPAGTAGCAARKALSLADGRPERAYGPFGATGLTTSRLGFGGYRIGLDDPAHRQALLEALREGCTLIDTSANYGDGESERLVGKALADLVRAGELTREAVIVVSKIGYVQGQNLAKAQAREKAGRPYPEMVKYGEGIWHCLHPEFLADQLEASLDRLGLETLDVCLLHNPEYFLSEAAHRGVSDLARLRDEFYGRLRAAFAYLETRVAAGQVQWYGVSSNTLVTAADEPDAVSLSRLLDAAREAGGAGHHCRVVQCPMNLFESGALLRPNTGPDGTRSVLQLAQAEGLALLVNRPLNAIPPDGRAMVRLADRAVEPQAAPFETLRGRVWALEEEFRREIAAHIHHGGQGLPPSDYFRWAEELARVRPQVQNLEHWEQVEGQMVAPHINQVLQALSRHLRDDLGDRWQDWRERYLPELLALLREMRREAAVQSRDRAAAIAAALDPLLPEDRRKEPLSRKALWTLVSTPGVACVLVGMRTPAYVEDALAVLRWAPLADPRPLYEAVARVR
jgi:hypothetical protein